MEYYGHETKVIAVINQKGGVGKTTTTANLGIALADMGKDVLLIDFDSQASLTNYLNEGLGDPIYGIYELLYKDFYPITPDEDDFLANHTFEELFESGEFIRRPTYKETYYDTVDGRRRPVQKDVEFGVSLIASDLILSDYELAAGKDRRSNGHQLAHVIDMILKWHPYDYILIDCNPSMGLMTMNAITAARDGLLIPTNLDLMSTRGIESLTDRIAQTQEELLRKYNEQHYGIIGIILNLYSERRAVDKQIESDMERFYPFEIFRATVPESVNAKKAVLAGRTYSQMYDKAKAAYDEMARELEEKLARMRETGPRIQRMTKKPESENE